MPGEPVHRRRERRRHGRDGRAAHDSGRDPPVGERISRRQQRTPATQYLDPRSTVHDGTQTRKPGRARSCPTWGPDVPASAGDVTRPDINEQCEAFLDAAPTAVSSIMGLFPPLFVARFKAKGIAWFATATTLDEAKQAQDAGADAVIAQGFEAGGHRGSFDQAAAERQLSGLFALVPRLADRLDVPIIAAGGIGDGRGVAAALTLGASAAIVGTAFLRCPEAKTHRAWADALADLEPEQTTLTRAFTGRLGRSIATDYVKAAASAERAAARAVPRSTRSHRAHEGSRRGRRRLSPHAGLGGPVGGHGESRSPPGSLPSRSGNRRTYYCLEPRRDRSSESSRSTPDGHERSTSTVRRCARRSGRARGKAA